MLGYKYTTEELANEARQTIDTQFGYILLNLLVLE